MDLCRKLKGIQITAVSFPGGVMRFTLKPLMDTDACSGLFTTKKIAKRRLVEAIPILARTPFRRQRPAMRRQPYPPPQKERPEERGGLGFLRRMDGQYRRDSRVSSELTALVP